MCAPFSEVLGLRSPVTGEKLLNSFNGQSKTRCGMLLLWLQSNSSLFWWGIAGKHYMDKPKILYIMISRKSKLYLENRRMTSGLEKNSYESSNRILALKKFWAFSNLWGCQRIILKFTNFFNIVHRRWILVVTLLAPFMADDPRQFCLRRGILQGEFVQHSTWISILFT